jgi:hypothetical protein
MNQMSVHFVDPTIPGLSGRDLRTHFVGAGQRLDRLLRQALAHLDSRQLRDLGIDRFSS